MIWDESLMASEYWKLSMYSFVGATASLDGLAKEYPELREMHAGFRQYTDLLKRELALARERGKTRYVVPPTVPLDSIARWTGLAKTDSFRRLMHPGTLPSMAFFNQKIRVYPVKEERGGLVWYTPTVPGEDRIPSMMILDASFPIRELEQADMTLKRVDEDVPVFASGEVTFLDAKRYDHVTVHQWCKHSGRDAMKKDFFGKTPEKPQASLRSQDTWLAERRAEQAVVRKVAKVASTVPLDEAMLFFVFKPQQFSQDNYRHILEEKLQHAGIDLYGTVPVLEYDRDGKPLLTQKQRVCVLTFGQETSLNDYSHVQNVFLVGMLHRDEEDVIGQYVVQCDGGDHEKITKQTGAQLVQSEVVHTIYQALSRGSCRVTEDGQARPMKAWIIHYSKGIRKGLDVVMPGAKWVDEWPIEGEAEAVKKTRPISPEAVRLREYLEGLMPEEFPVLVRTVKEQTGLDTVTRKAWRRISEEAIEGTTFAASRELKAFISMAPAPFLLG